MNGTSLIKLTDAENFNPAIDGSPDQIRAASSLLFERLAWLRQAGMSFNGARDMYQVLGYKRNLTTADYRERYERGGIAGRIVDAMPDATWRGEVELWEDPDSTDYTPFEQAWKDLDRRLQIQAKFVRVDKLARLSTFAAILIGSRQSGDLSVELPKGGPDDLIYLQSYAGGGSSIAGSLGEAVAASRAASLGADCVVQEYETDAANPRFGQVKFYQLKRTTVSSPDLMKPVHWTRIVHVAEGMLYDESFGFPALERIWNLLDDLDKVTGGGAEAFWLRANQGLHLDVDKDMKMSDEKDTLSKLREQADEYANQMTRMIRTRGVNVKTLGSDVANFANQADAILTQIAGAKAMPKRVLTGSEMGELASSQDRDNWKDQINGRQTQYAGPVIVRQLADRLIKYGYLPTPANGPDAYDVKWPHIQVLTDQEKADGAKSWALTNQANGAPVFTEDETRSHWYNMGPIAKQKVVAQPRLRAALENEITDVLRAAIKSGDKATIDKVIGLADG